MYKQNPMSVSTLKVRNVYIGETIEQKVRRIVSNKEPIKDGAPLIYTERKDGVNPDMDIRTDRWEHAIDAMDKVAKTHKAKREERASKKTEDRKTTEVIPRPNQEQPPAPGESKA